MCSSACVPETRREVRDTKQGDILLYFDIIQF